MPLTTSDDLVRDLNIERSQLLDRMIDAHCLLSRSTVWLDDLPSPAAAKLLSDIKAHLEAGLFGDREVK